MEVKVCKGCKQLFNYNSGPELCPICIESISSNNGSLNIQQKELILQLISENNKEEILYQEVKEYILKNPNNNIIQVSNATNVSPSLLLKWVKDGRLIAVNNGEDKISTI